MFRQLHDFESGLLFFHTCQATYKAEKEKKYRPIHFFYTKLVLVGQVTAFKQLAYRVGTALFRTGILLQEVQCESDRTIS